MLFNSIQFLLFFPAVTIIFFLIPHKLRWLWLLMASCYFYMAFIPIYIFILFFTIIIDYLAGIFIEKLSGKKRKLFLILSLVTNIGVLVFFKYFNFFNSNFSELFNMLGYNYPIPYINIILPIGLSFHTFQAMSYTIEVYRGNQKAERHFGIYSLYVMFYPQLVAGPIERPQNMLHQFHEPKTFSIENLKIGLKMMAWGMFKKVVIADRLSLFVNRVFDHPHQYENLSLIIATVFFSFQIYCDFSGYSDIALGSAKCMGFDLMENFRRPYFARSVSEFWKRWHISLSTWFKDYVYIPLGGNRVSKYRWYLNLLFVFIISGLWHGANWTFIYWGALHGIFLILGIIPGAFIVTWLKKQGVASQKLTALAQSPLVFILVSMAWVFFRAKNISDAFYIISHLGTNIGSSISAVLHNTNISRYKILYLNTSSTEFFLTIFLVLFLLYIDWLHERHSFWNYVSTRHWPIKWGFYFFLAYGTLFLGVFEKLQFIYFQF